MIDSTAACVRRRVRSRWARTQGEAHAGCMGEAEDAVPATIRSVIQGCGEFGIDRLSPPAGRHGHGANGGSDASWAVEGHLGERSYRQARSEYHPGEGVLEKRGIDHRVRHQ